MGLEGAAHGALSESPGGLHVRDVADRVVTDLGRVADVGAFGVALHGGIADMRDMNLGNLSVFVQRVRGLDTVPVRAGDSQPVRLVLDLGGEALRVGGDRRPVVLVVTHLGGEIAGVGRGILYWIDEK